MFSERSGFGASPQSSGIGSSRDHLMVHLCSTYIITYRTHSQSVVVLQMRDHRSLKVVRTPIRSHLTMGCIIVSTGYIMPYSGRARCLLV